MPYRRTTFVNGNFYHIYNKCDFKGTSINLQKEFQHILDSIKYYQYQTILRFSSFNRMAPELKKAFLPKNKLIELIAFSVMPNHYHFLLKQIAENGVRNFISLFQLSLAKYLNLKYELKGQLFVNRFQSVNISTYELLLHISRYIHLNPVTAYLIDIEQLINYPFTSFKYYCNDPDNDLVNTKYISSDNYSLDNYKQFVYDNADYQRKLKQIQKLTLDQS